jgi:hypothetical protein
MAASRAGDRDASGTVEGGAERLGRRPQTRQELLDRELVRLGLTDHSPPPPGERGVAPTRQTVRRSRRDPLRRLLEDARLAPAHVAAAEEILLVLEALSRAVTRRAFDPGLAPAPGRGQRRPLAGFLAEPVRPKYRRYRRWAQYTGTTLCGRGAAMRSLLSVVLDLLVDGWSYRKVEGSLGLRHGVGHAQAMLRFALTCYALDAGWLHPRDLR